MLLIAAHCTISFTKTSQVSRRGRYADKLLQFSLRWDIPFRHKSHKHTLLGRGREGCAPARRHMLGDLFTALCLVQDQHPVKALTDSRTRACVSPELASRIYIYCARRSERRHLISRIGKTLFRDWQMSSSVWLSPASNNEFRSVGLGIRARSPQLAQTF